MQDQFYNTEEDDNEGNLFQNISKYLFYWKWFILSVFICLTVAFYQLRYATPQYKATSKIVVRDEKKGNIASELGAFADMGLLTGMKNNIDNEVEILNSITLIEKTIKRLNFTITYFRIGDIRDVELHNKTKPFEFTIENASEVFFKSEQVFRINIISDTVFELESSEGASLGSFKFGTSIAVGEAKIKITKLPDFATLEPIDESFYVHCEPLLKLGSMYSKLLTVEALSKTSSIVNLSISNPVPEKAAEFLDGLVAIYNEEAINDKNMISENTQRFIEKRLEIISEELGDVEGKSEGFKKTNQIIDIPTNAKIYLENYSNFEKSLVETETQLRVIEIMINFMKNKSKAELVPSDIIPSGVGSLQNPLIVQHNNLVLQRNRVLKDGTQKNYVLVNLDQQLEGIDRDIKESLSQLKGSLLVKKKDLEKQDALLSGKINQIPTQEREFRILERQQKIKEGLYLYLIQKREETAIALSVTEANAKIIDAGRIMPDPISPKKTIYYLVALIVGLGIPFTALYFLFLFDNKIKNANDVEAISKKVPILSELPNIIDTNEASSLKKEAFRTLLNSTNFITPNNENNEGQVIFVTSSTKGEGKTFVSYNLAVAYSDLNKKTILIGADCRNPQLHKYFNQNRKEIKGLTNYLHEPNLNWQDLLSKSEEEGPFKFDVLLAGDIPPNPTLLLSNPRFANLILELKKEYDIIIFDTAPTLLVSDTLIISKFADTTLYVVRAGVTEKNLINYCVKLSEDKKINNMGLVINDIDFSRSYGYGYGYGYSYGYGYGYNYGYGYGYGKEEIKKPWYKKSILGKLFR